MLLTFPPLSLRIRLMINMCVLKREVKMVLQEAESARARFGKDNLWIKGFRLPVEIMTAIQIEVAGPLFQAYPERSIDAFGMDGPSRPGFWRYMSMLCN